MKTTFIYALNDPETGECRYIGKSDNPKERVERHIIECKGEIFCRARWINDLVERDTKPVLEILDEVPYNDWKFWERMWIKTSRAIGMDLVNGTDGGDGFFLDGKHPMLGKKHSVETKAKISANGKGLKKPIGYGEKISARQRGEKNHRFGKPATKGFSGHKHSLDSKEKIGEKSTAYWLANEHPQLGGLGTFLGKKHSEVSKIKMRYSRILMGKNISGRLPRHCKISIGAF